jgi:hypothetical protein
MVIGLNDNLNPDRVQNPVRVGVSVPLYPFAIV